MPEPAPCQTPTASSGRTGGCNARTRQAVAGVLVRSGAVGGSGGGDLGMALVESLLLGIAQVKKATGIATVAAWVLLGLAYIVAFALQMLSTFSLEMFHNLYEKPFGAGFGLSLIAGFLVFFPKGMAAGKPFMDNVLDTFMQTIVALLAIALGLLCVGAVLHLAFTLMLGFARWLHHGGIPAWKAFCDYITIAWFVLIGCCLAILLMLHRRAEALKLALELLKESVQEIGEFFFETIWRSRTGSGS